MKVDRVLETALYAVDLAAAEDFYTRVLGLEVYSRVAGRHVFFRCGAGMFLVFNPDQTEKEKDAHGCRGRGHVAWAVPEGDLDEWLRWLGGKGIIVNDFSWPKGGRSLYFSDPAGNSLEITTFQLWSISEAA